MDKTPLLTVRNLTLGHLNGYPLAQDLSFTLKDGEVLSVLGRNGVGKSTLLNCLRGLIHPREGEAQLCGARIHGMKPAVYAKTVAVVPQHQASAFDFTVLDYVLMGRTAHLGLFASPDRKARDLAMEVLVRVGLSHLACGSITAISGGERQMAAIARALVQEPRLLLLDEPTSHLDMANQNKVLGLLVQLNREGMAILTTSHFPEHARDLGGAALVLTEANGHLLGPVEEMVTPAVLERAYGLPISIASTAEGRIACLPTHL
jgi:iron complex transport system ATP-binding protein